MKIQPNNSHFTNMFETLHPQQIKKDTWVLSRACLCFFLTCDLLKPSTHLARNSRSQFGSFLDAFRGKKVTSQIRKFPVYMLSLFPLTTYSLSEDTIIIPNVVNVSKLTSFMFLFTKLNRHSVLSEKPMLETTVGPSKFS